jgi:hypothetical protein
MSAAVIHTRDAMKDCALGGLETGRVFEGEGCAEVDAEVSNDRARDPWILILGS